ncbi:heme ABC exporter ATP-binding protein CcmA [Deinococcus cellulosilyticus]|uniref:Heme ABC exporter ATP-binding protein CcmA n=1 Tax=Deinococcus cellulosilyticus (strain DSM 18568 / NBRC 106333 / KACC 11606 / 5516J-15) TaxID=1223518 RepID=A0A511N8X5_DEIC1|nr:heme ABC exporter ATP-binding protein CcmA [Deinococcus cellulosilyticus]GEM48841.1 heme ABC exporter ATP-binding protein CcmA [Deinococcus cellulosilyticus NBRC 106333 = KACC 11606]
MQTLQLARRFAKSWVLRDITFSVEEGETVVLFGENGAGKTTLLRVLSGVLSPHRGEGRIFGYDLKDRRSVREHAFFLSNDQGLYADLTVLENLTFTAQMYGVKTDLKAIVQRVGLEQAGGKRARELSSGMRKRALLGRMLIAPGPLLLIDEPFANLDEAGKQFVLSILQEAQQQNKTLIFTSHEPDLALQLTSRQYTLRGGTFA